MNSECNQLAVRAFVRLTCDGVCSFEEWGTLLPHVLVSSVKKQIRVPEGLFVIKKVLLVLSPAEAFSLRISLPASSRRIDKTWFKNGGRCSYVRNLMGEKALEVREVRNRVWFCNADDIREFNCSKTGFYDRMYGLGFFSIGGSEDV